jgi:hypothetical protein
MTEHGTKHVLQDRQWDQTENKTLDAAGSPQLIGSFKLCITAGGAVASVAMLKSTGSAAYDRKIERELFGWKYRLFTVDSVPVPVCTAITFVYSQH